MSTISSHLSCMHVDPRSLQVLITGGTAGIGLGLARRYHGAGASVLVTGRSAEALGQAAAELPGLRTVRSDIGDPGDREALAAHVRRTMPGLNLLINNAGIQRRVPLAADGAPWAERQREIDILLGGPVHLDHLLVPTMLRHGGPCAVVNVSSGGAFLPQPFAPVYSACKAALHSYTVNLRFALAGTPCRVVELIPPAVATRLAGPGATHGEPLDAFCDAAFAALMAGDADEIGFGMTAGEGFAAARVPYRRMFAEFSGRFPVERYG